MVINTAHRLQFANQEAHEQALDIASKIEGSHDETRLDIRAMLIAGSAKA